MFIYRSIKALISQLFVCLFTFFILFSIFKFFILLFSIFYLLFSILFYFILLFSILFYFYFIIFYFLFYFIFIFLFLFSILFYFIFSISFFLLFCFLIFYFTLSFVSLSDMYAGESTSHLSLKLVLTGLFQTISAPPLCLRMCPPLTTKNISSYKALLAAGQSLWLIK